MIHDYACWGYLTYTPKGGVMGNSCAKIGNGTTANVTEVIASGFGIEGGSLITNPGARAPRKTSPKQNELVLALYA